MRAFRTLILLGLFGATSASAQEMYPGQSVTVNPNVAGTRGLSPLQQPGAPYPGSDLPPVHLHMPVPHHRVARVTHRAPKETSGDITVATSGPDPSVHTTSTPDIPQSRKKAKPEPAASSDGGGIPFSLDGTNATPAPPPPSKPVKTATAEPKPAPPPPAEKPAPAPKPESAAPAKGDVANPEPGLTRRGEIVFSHDAADPAPAQYDGLKRLAGDINASLQSGASRVQIRAYGGAPGDKGSDARRISLRRALAVRQLLIDDGVPSSKIDVRAMGGIDDTGNADRVDVYVRGAS
ncbi:MAG TPA: OmpA family protein [Rhizomicrobium sp.]|jgi:outer membrane protein OmpA-like peptidoglycan-associated protein